MFSASLLKRRSGMAWFIRGGGTAIVEFLLSSASINPLHFNFDSHYLRLNLKVNESEK
jgi:hypothetical protein